MEQTIIFLEKLSFGTHPCLEEESYDGWNLRFVKGYTKRANSVSMLQLSSLPLNEKIAYCEEMYKNKKLSTIFKITPLSLAADAVLEELEYKAVDKTNVMTLELDIFLKASEYEKHFQEKTKAETVSVSINNKITEEWQNTYFTLNQVSATSIPTAKMIQSKITNPLLCATIYQDKKAVACGLGVMEQGYVGLLDIVVDEEYRGFGFGKLLCQSLLAKGKENGATTGYLQVVDANTVAKNLYAKLGFVAQYSYWYRVKG